MGFLHELPERMRGWIHKRLQAAAADTEDGAVHRAHAASHVRNHAVRRERRCEIRPEVLGALQR